MNEFQPIEPGESVSLEEIFGGMDFDYEAAFNEVFTGIVSDKEKALNEQVQEVELLLKNTLFMTSMDQTKAYYASQMQADCCSHEFREAVKGNDFLNSFMEGHEEDDGHGHAQASVGHHEDEDDKKNSKKKKRTASSKEKAKPKATRVKNLGIFALDKVKLVRAA